MSNIERKRFNYNTIADKSLATYLKGEETAIRAASRRAQGELIEIGQRLEAAKERAGHGMFMEWTEGALGYTHRHAMGFIHVAQTFGKMEFNSNLPLSQTAIFVLASPSVSDETRVAAIKAADDGKLKTVADAKAFVASPENHALDNAHNDDIGPDPFDDTTPEAPDNIENYGEDAQPVAEPTPAEQYAAATVVSDTIGDAPAVNENDLTDDEWLMTLPLFKLFVSRGNKALLLRGDALAWRTLQQAKAFGSFRHHAQKAFDFSASRTPLASIIYKACNVRHPKEWGGCVTCRGKGCTDCNYTGAAIDGGLTIEQMEARA